MPSTVQLNFVPSCMDVARIIGKANAGLDELLAECCRNIASDYQLSLVTVYLPDHSVHKASVQI